MGAWIAEKVNRMQGKVRVLIPQGGVSAIDVTGQPFHDPDADAALFDALCSRIASDRVRRLDCAINDPEFAAAAVAAWREIS